MLLHVAIIYAVSWLGAGAVWAGVEVVRLNRLGPMPASLDRLGFVCALWLAAPATPLMLAMLAGRRR